MPKNVLFSLKNCKIRQNLAALFPAPRLLHQSSYIVNSFLCTALKAQTLSKSTNGPSFLLIITGVHQAFGVENYIAFLMPQTTEIITIDFNFFRFLPPPPFPFPAGHPRGPLYPNWFLFFFFFPPPPPPIHIALATPLVLSIAKLRF